jgi:hypothetical protein
MLGRFSAVVLVDFEFCANAGERPAPICMVAHELRSGQRWRLFWDELGPKPPFPTGPDVLVVAYYASAELGCFKVLGWRPPLYILDLFAEFRDRTNGLSTPAGVGLLGALVYFGLDHIGTTEKKEMRDLAMRGGPWSRHERGALLDYCGEDVEALGRLLSAILPRIDLPRALLRGRYMTAAAAMEHNGVPLDVVTLGLLRENWTKIQDELIAAIDIDYDVFAGRTFKADRWEHWLRRHGIPWPTTETGALSLADDTFRQMAKAYPAVSPMRELRSSLAEMRLSDLAVGRDGRNRTILSAFPVPHRAKPALQLKIHFRTERLAARADPATARPWRCVRRLAATRVWDRGGVVRRCSHAGRLSVR